MDPFESARRAFDEAAELLGLSPDMRAFLREPVRELRFTIPVQMDEGCYQTVRAFRVQHNDARGPVIGGLRFHPGQSVDAAGALAASMTWKTAVLDLPLGGAWGGALCDAKNMSPGELERLSRGYAQRLARFTDPAQDVLIPHGATSAQVMGWIADEYEAVGGRRTVGAAAGRPTGLFGQADRTTAAALGGVYAIKWAAGNLGLDLSGETAAIEGYGSLGRRVHRLACERLGLKVVAISDARGGIYDPNGLDYDAVEVWQHETGSVAGFKNADALPLCDLLALPVTVLIPTALEGVIDAVAAERVQASILAELSDAPTAPEADVALHERGVCVIPDIVCSGGGLIAAYLEHVQSVANFYFPPRELDCRIEEILAAACGAMDASARSRGVHNRLAALLVALQRVAEAVTARGWVR